MTRKPVPVTEAPPCMDAEEFEVWTYWNRMSGPANAKSPCTDCSLGFAVEMRAEGRCDGRPLGIQDPDDDMSNSVGWFPQRHEGFDYDAIRRSAYVRGERKRERARQAAAMSRQGMKRREIAEALNVKVWTVGVYLRMERAA